MDKKYDLEERLVRAENHLRNQLIRSSTGACLNYGEAQGAESKKDFVHKNGIVLKELKESRSTLKILTYSEFGNAVHRALLLKEPEELCAIFGKIIFNTKKNMNQ